MTCEQAREELSARMDGEGDPQSAPRADAHLALCPACAQWLEQASAVTRLARTSAAMPGPALSDSAMAKVLQAAPRPAQTGAPRIAAALRIGLLAVGLAQFLLGIAQISQMAGLADAHIHTDGIPVSSGHLWHESAAWNVAVGTALAWLAWRRSRPATLLPVMTAFVAVLTLLTVNDALSGTVETGRILSHSLLLTGYLLLLVSAHPRLRGQQPPAASATPGGGWSIRGEEDDGGPAARIYPFPVRVRAASSEVTVQRQRAA